MLASLAAPLIQKRRRRFLHQLRRKALRLHDRANVTAAVVDAAVDVGTSVTVQQHRPELLLEPRNRQTHTPRCRARRCRVRTAHRTWPNLFSRRQASLLPKPSQRLWLHDSFPSLLARSSNAPRTFVPEIPLSRRDSRNLNPCSGD